MSYGGKSVSDTISVDVVIRLDIKHPQHPRLRFQPSDQSAPAVSSVELVLEAGRRNCQTKMTYMADDIADKISPMEAEMKVTMLKELWPASPLQEPHSARSIFKSLSINKNCKNNLVCVPDLQLNVTM